MGEEYKDAHMDEIDELAFVDGRVHPTVLVVYSDNVPARDWQEKDRKKKTHVLIRFSLCINELIE